MARGRSTKIMSMMGWTRKSKVLSLSLSVWVSNRVHREWGRAPPWGPTVGLVSGLGTRWSHWLGIGAIGLVD